VRKGLTPSKDVLHAALCRALDVSTDANGAVNTESCRKCASTVHALLKSDVVPSRKTIRYAKKHGQPGWEEALSDARQRNKKHFSPKAKIARLLHPHL